MREAEKGRETERERQRESERQRNFEFNLFKIFILLCVVVYQN